MASELNISQPAYSKIEKGETKLNLECVVKIATILDLELHELLDSMYTINNFNNKDNSHAIGLVENLYQDNKENIQATIKILQEENQRLSKENGRLITLLEKFMLKH
ncbi:MAG: helix-turn-helix transcriptional regulator [Flavobacteriaceae bacterium]|nr:helix-turn-helix transcriptional regulator [Flavobacteriaceae bacterium]